MIRRINPPLIIVRGKLIAGMHGSFIFADGNTKFLVQKYKNAVAAPLFSNTEGRVYVTFNAQGNIAAITKYGKDHKSLFSIHEPHATERVKEVHMHIGYGADRIRIGWENMTQEHKNLYQTIKQKVSEMRLGEKAKGGYSNNGR